MSSTKVEIEDIDAKCFICSDSDYKELVEEIKERMKRIRDAKNCEWCSEQEGHISLV